MQVFPVYIDVHKDRIEPFVRYKSMWVVPRMNEYLGRSLSYESDILNAFVGVLRQAWLLPEPSYHFGGLPFSSESTDNVARTEYTTSPRTCSTFEEGYIPFMDVGRLARSGRILRQLSPVP